MELGSSPPFARALSILCTPEVWTRLPNTIFAFVSSGKRKLEACWFYEKLFKLAVFKD